MKTGHTFASSPEVFLLLLMSMPLAAARPDGAPDSAAPAWVADAVFYQIFPERFSNGDPSNDPPGTEPWEAAPTTRNFFGGDLRGIIERLPYLRTLGVTALYLNPIFHSPTNHKYQTTDCLKIDPHFGDEAVFRELVEACHAGGLRIILDAVFNHTGVGFFAFDDLKRNGAASRYRDWYKVREFPVGPPSRPNYECWWGHGSLPKLMTGNPEVRHYLFDVTRHWMDCGIDGWRLDVPNEIPHDFWIAWRRLVKSLNPDAYIVGEIWQDAGPWLRGDQFDGVMNYPFRDACLAFFAHDTISVSRFDALLERQRRGYPEGVPYALQNLLGSHDTERFLTLCGGDERVVQLAWLFQMTYPGAPMVYYGDETGMEGGRDPDCRRPMVWEPAPKGAAMLGRMRELIALRAAHSELRRGGYESVLADNGRKVLVYARRLGGREALVMLNRSTAEHRITVARPGTSFRLVWPERAVGMSITDTTITATVGPLSGVVFIGGE